MAWKYGYIDSKGTFIPVDVYAYEQISSEAKPVFYNDETRQYFEYSQVLGNDVGGDAFSKQQGVAGITYFLNYGHTKGLQSGHKVYVNNFIKENGGRDTWADYDPTAGFSAAQKKYIKTIAPVVTSEEAQANAKEDAFNEYYKDLYSLREGTQGKEMYDRLTETYINEADAQYNLADASYQQMALQQAQVVKQITDRVRSERMARLRAGMSESQIANQDMQMLMANVDALNQQAYAMQQQKLEAQTNRGLAQDKAYNDYLAQTAQKGQVAAALYASDVANPTMQTLQKLWQLYPNGGWTAEDYERVSNEVIGNTKPGT